MATSQPGRGLWPAEAVGRSPPPGAWVIRAGLGLLHNIQMAGTASLRSPRHTVPYGTAGRSPTPLRQRPRDKSVSACNVTR